MLNLIIFQMIGPQMIFFYSSYFPVFLCVCITLIITFTRAALMFLHLSQVMTDWQIVKCDINCGLSALGVREVPKENKTSLWCHIVLSSDQVEAMACRETQGLNRLPVTPGASILSLQTTEILLLSELEWERGDICNHTHVEDRASLNSHCSIVDEKNYSLPGMKHES